MSAPRHHERDPMLRRIARRSAVIAVVFAVLALAAERGRPGGALGVMAGAGLMAFSYRVIRESVDARAERAGSVAGGEADAKRPGVLGAAWVLTKYVSRYGVLAVAAWAVLVPLRASPVWLFVGVSVPVAATIVEAALVLRQGRTK